jgi:glycosyltransferase involved in cell wall biosynthesis
MKLTVLICTFNRSQSLSRTIKSLLNASPAKSLQTEILVVDNNSTDDTRKVVEELQNSSKTSKIKIKYLFEARQGKSFALNAGLSKIESDLVGMIDDDEEIFPDWFEKVAEVFAKRFDEVDFIAGPYEHDLEIPLPAWVPEDVCAPIGAGKLSETEKVFGDDFEATPAGGNFVIKLSALREVGFYNESLGYINATRIGGEDDEMYLRLKKAGKKGIYRPDLVVRHFIPASRLTKKFYRNHLFCWAMAQSVIENLHSDSSGAKILGVPRYLFGDAARAFFGLIASSIRFNKKRAFQNELKIWVLAGYLNASLKNRQQIRNSSGG